MDPNSEPFVPFPIPLPTLETKDENLQVKFNEYKEDYDLVKPEPIGGGSYGFTRLVRSKKDGKVYAMKTMYTKHLGDVLAEIWISSRFRYLHIISVYEVYFKYIPNKVDVDTLDSSSAGLWRLDIIMEEAKPIMIKEISIEQKWMLIHQLIGVLAFLQGNDVVYGDIKLANLLVSNEGDLKLIDLGMYYKVGYGEPPITQSYSDLGGYHKQRKPIYKSKVDRSPRTITYDVLKNAMWALGMTIIEILTALPLDHKPNIEGVPIVVYEITDNPSYLSNILKGYEGWIPLVGNLLLDPPKKFADLLWSPVFSNITFKYWDVLSTAHVLEPAIPMMYMKESTYLNTCMRFIYHVDRTAKSKKIDLFIPPESKCMAALYFIHYLLPIGLGLDWKEYKDLTLPSELLSHHMKLRFVNIDHYPNIDMKNIRTSGSLDKKMLLGLPMFALACLVFGQAVISSEYEVLSIEWLKATLAVSLGSICPNVDILMSGIIYYMEALMYYTNGNFLLPNPYFALSQQNPNLANELLKLSANYDAYAKYMNTYINLKPIIVSPVNEQRLPRIENLIGELRI